MPRGRPRKDKEREYLLALVAHGLTVVEAGTIVRLSKGCVSQWKKRDSAFRSQLLSALKAGKAIRRANRQKSFDFLSNLQVLRPMT